MINIIENSNAQICEYNLIDTITGNVLDNAKLTKYEVHIKNYAYALNRTNKKYELLVCEEDYQDKTKLILPC
jgi:hypothetical protein